VTGGDVTRVRLRAAADEVVEVLSDAIRSGVYEVGERLPAEHDLATKLGVSRPVLRDALLVLRRAGVVTVRRGANGGTFVESLGNIHRLLAEGSAPGLDAVSLLEARRAVEPVVALLTAQRATDEQLHELERLVEALEPLLGVPEEFYEVDIRFHLALGDMAGNAVLGEFQRLTLSRLSVVASEYLAREADVGESLARQRDLAAAIRSRRPRRVLEAVDEHLTPLEQRFAGRKLDFPTLS
jgi:DNA-binding FadR family transcriptional regulator